MKHSVLAVELCARFEGSLHGTLHRLLTSQPVNMGYQQKWEFYKNVCEEIAAAFSLVDRGCWDYFNDDAQARASYDQWVGGMTTEEGARREPSGSDPYRGEARYLTFTMAFLIVQDSPCDLAIRSVCDIPNDLLWRRTTFQRILSGMRSLNFAAIKSDVAYLIPRDDGWGLTQGDLDDKKFEYLRMLQ